MASALIQDMLRIMEVYRLLKNNGLITETERLARTITLLQAQMV
jgi:hypothetical protein